MKRVRLAMLAAVILLLGLIVAPPAGAVPPPAAGPDGVHVYAGALTAGQLAALVAAGVDREEMRLVKRADGKISVEVILSSTLADRLARQGITLTAQSVAARSRTAAKGDGVFKRYAGAGGLRQDIVNAANAKPGIAKVVDLGNTLNGTPLTAIKVTKDARKLADGKRKAVLYMAAQHAREWITPEMVPPAAALLPRRLRHRPARSPSS